MAKSCSIDAHVRNKNGEVVVSNLWRDLMTFTNSNRFLSRQYYKLGTNPEYLNLIKDKATFDENGEITFESLRKIAKLRFKNDEILEKVRGSFRASGLTQDEAIQRVDEFNRESQFKKRYLATFNEETDGTYTIDVVHRNKVNEQILKDSVKAQRLKTFLVEKLRELHCNVEFIENAPFRGQYNSINLLEKYYNSAYTLVRIAKGLPLDIQNKVLSKEIGHFVVGVLGRENNLIKRLKQELSKDGVLEAYIRKYENESFLANDELSEVMGHLIGDAVYRRLTTTTTPLERLLLRIKNNVLSKFVRFKNERQLLTALLKVDSTLDNIVDGFIKGDSAYDLKKAVEENRAPKEEVLYDSEQGEAYKRLYEVLLDRQRITNKISGKEGYNMTRKINALLEELEDHKAMVSDIDLRYLRNAVLVLLNDIKVSTLSLGEGVLNRINNMSEYSINNDILNITNELYKAGAYLMHNIGAYKALNQLSASVPFNRLELPAEGAEDLDLFIGRNSSSASNSDIDLGTYNNTDAVFDEIDRRSGKFRTPEGEVNRTAGYYEDTDGKRYVRFHRVIDAHNGESIPSSTEIEEDVHPSAIRGNRVDAFLRVMFESKGEDYDRAVEEANSDVLGDSSKLEENYMKKLQEEAINLMKTWAKQGIKWKANNMIVSTALGGIRIAGELDLLLKYPNGHLMVWDMKTTSKTLSDEFGPRNNLQYEAQINFYAIALKSMGYNAQVGGILQIMPIIPRIGSLFLYHVKQDLSINDIRIKPFMQNSEYLNEKLRAQFKKERENPNNTLETQTYEEQSFIETITQDPAKQELIKRLNYTAVMEFIKTHFPKYEKASRMWFSNQDRANNPIPPYKIFQWLGIDVSSKLNELITTPVERENVKLSHTKSDLLAITNTTRETFSRVTEKVLKIWFSNLYGDDLVKVMGKGIHYGKKEGENTKSYYAATDDVYLPMETILKELRRDVNSIEFLLSPMTHSYDIPTQLIHKMIEEVNNRANQETARVTKQLFYLKRKYKMDRKLMLELFERDERGNLTGNYVGETHLGNWERDKKNALSREALQEEFNNYVASVKNINVEDIASVPEAEKEVLWVRWYLQKYKTFHKGVRVEERDAQNKVHVRYVNGHSILVEDSVTHETRLEPNPNYVDENGIYKYRNPAYDRLSDAQKAFLKEIRAIKDAQDVCLGSSNVTISQRAPQLVASSKLDYLTNKTPDSIINKLWRREVLDRILRNNNDILYGNDETQIDKEEWFEDLYSDPKTHVSEVPMFFIRKLDNPNDMSTDLIGGLIAYTSMAQSYNGLSEAKSAIELAYKQLTSRPISRENRKHGLVDKLILPINSTVASTIFEDTLGDTSNSRYARSLRAYLESNLYSRKAVVLGSSKILWNKILGGIGSLPVIRYLWGNVHGATVNTGTGFLMIAEEAVVGEDLAPSTTWLAHALFTAYIPASFLGIFKWVPGAVGEKGILKPINKFLGELVDSPDENVLGKLNAWFNYFNARGDAAFQDKHKGTVRPIISFSDLMMAPYTIGDYYMQGMAYLIKALGTRVYDSKENKYVRMFKAYKNKDGVLEIDQERFFKSKEFAMDYNVLQTIYNNISTLQSNNRGQDVTGISFTEEELNLLNKYLKSKEVRYMHSGNLLLALERLLKENRVGSPSYESEYIDKCRAIDDRMHGIYNKMNKPLLHSSILGEIMFTFKNFLLGYIERDWSAYREDVVLKRGHEGVYITYLFRYLPYTFKNFRTNVFNNVFLDTILGLIWTPSKIALTTGISSLGTLPILPNAVSKLTKGKVDAARLIKLMNPALGDYQVNNLKRLGAKINCVALLQFVIAPLLGSLAVSRLEDDDPDNDMAGLRWLFAYYIVRRLTFEQLSTFLITGTVVDLTKMGLQKLKQPDDTQYQTGWLQEISRNSSFAPVQLSALASIYEDIVQMWGYFFSEYEVPDFEQEEGESNAEFKKRVKEWDEAHNSFYNRTHYRRNKTKWLKDYEGDFILDENDNKIPVHNTPWQRALHNEYIIGDPKMFTRLAASLPFIKTQRVFFNEQSTKNYLFGTKVKSR